MSVFSKCIAAKLAEGKIDQQGANELLKRLKDTPGDAEARKIIKGLLDDYETNLQPDLKQSYNLINTMDEIDHLVATGSFKDIQARNLEGLTARSRANQNIIQHNFKKTYEMVKIKPFWNSTEGRKLVEKEVVSELYGNAVGGADSKVMAQEMRQAIKQANQLRRDAGHVVAADDEAIRARVMPVKMANLDKTKAKNLILNAVDATAFEKKMDKFIKKAGGIDELFDELQRAYSTNFDEDLKNNPMLLKEAFEDALIPKEGAAYEAISSALGTGSFYTDQFNMFESIAFRTARDSSWGATEAAAKAVNDRTLAQMKASGKFDSQQINQMKKTLEDRLKLAYGKFSHYNLDSDMYKAAIVGSDALRSATSGLTASLSIVNTYTDQGLVRRFLADNVEQRAATSNYLKNLVKTGKARQRGLEMGIMADLVIGDVASYFEPPAVGGGFLQQIKRGAGQFQTLFGMRRTTNSTQANVSTMMLVEMSTMVREVPYEQLTAKDLKVLRMGGITKDDYLKIRDLAKINDDTSLIDIVKMSEHPDLEVRRLAAKIDTAIVRGREIATPTGSDFLRLQKARQHDQGLAQGVVMDNLGMFMSYTTSYFRDYMLKPFDDGLKEGAESVALTVATLTVAGALGLMSRDLAEGKIPDPTDSRYLTYGLANAVGPIVYFKSQLFGNQYPTATGALMGAAGKFPTALYKAFADNISDYADGKDTSFRWDLFKAFYGMIPKGHPASLVLERLVYDKLQLILDPNGARNLRARMNRWIKEHGDWWWRPGDDLTDVVE